LLTEIGHRTQDIKKNSNYENLKLITGLLLHFFRVFEDNLDVDLDAFSATKHFSINTVTQDNTGKVTFTSR
jgi:hypothetical protein